MAKLDVTTLPLAEAIGPEGPAAPGRRPRAHQALPARHRRRRPGAFEPQRSSRVHEGQRYRWFSVRTDAGTLYDFNESATLKLEKP
jgi:hypothetical protein